MTTVAVTAPRVTRWGRMTLTWQPRYAVVVAALTLAVVLAGYATLSFGQASVPFDRLVAALTGHGTPGEHLVVNQLRLPRLVNAVLVGFALGLAGALFQQLTKNPLGSPDIVGFDTGAAAGGLVSLLIVGGGVLTTSLGAVAGGAVTTLLVFLLANRQGIDSLRLVLVGIGVGSLLGALNSMLLVSASIYDAQSAAQWLIGNLAGRDWNRVAYLAPVVVLGTAAAVGLSRSLRIHELHDDHATSLGLNPDRLRLMLGALGILLASSAVATAGPIMFIALTAPQIAARLTRASGAGLVAAGLMGSLLLVLADHAARELFQPRQIAVGVITGVIGGLYLVWLLTREWRKGRA